MQYTEYQPAPDLHPFVDRYWMLSLVRRPRDVAFFQDEAGDYLLP